MTTPAAKAHIDQLERHVEEVLAGRIPADSPPDFVAPTGDAAVVDGKPWWYGPDFHPTEAALVALESPDSGR